MHRTLAAVALASLGSPLFAQASWSQLYTSFQPPPGDGGVMACHEASGDVVMMFDFGYTQSTAAWVLRDTAWSAMPGPTPPDRRFSAMVYDSVQQKLVVFGGTGSSGDLQDTWEWDGVTWTNPNPAVKPPARFSHAMAFDRERGVTVLFGGYLGSAGSYMQDLWEWDGLTWQQRMSPAGPTARAAAMMAFDPVRRSVLLHGGFVSISGTLTAYNDTWSWDGVGWQQHTPTTPPPYRQFAAAVSDLHRRRVVLQGGRYASEFAWEWDGSEWHLQLQPSPSARQFHVMAYDAPRRRVVLHGGKAGDFLVNDTWIYQTPSPADAAPYGSGCAGSAGVPVLVNAPYELPWLGDTVHHLASGIPPGEPGAMFVSSFTQLAPTSLAVVGMPGCDLLLSLDVAEFEPAVAGVAEWTLAIPNTLALAGVPFYQQAFVLDGPANTLGLTASNGIEVTPGIR